MFKTLKQDAAGFLDSYKTKGPASYAAAEQAIGAILITDGFVGLESPFGQKKRPGIFGTLGGIFFGLVFMFVPTFFGSITGLDKMTATTQATVTEVGQPAYSTNSDGRRGAATCYLTARYTIGGQEYSNTSSMSSSDNCSTVVGQQISVNYNPASPGAWANGVPTTNRILGIFRWVGVLIVLSSIVTFFIRLMSIIFGWKLLRDGRKNAAALPEGTNLGTMVSEIKQNFISSVFGFGAQQNAPAPISPAAMPAPVTPTPAPVATPISTQNPLHNS